MNKNKKIGLLGIAAITAVLVVTHGITVLATEAPPSLQLPSDFTSDTPPGLTVTCGNGTINGTEECDFGLDHNNDSDQSNSKTVFQAFTNPAAGKSKTAYMCSETCTSSEDTITTHSSGGGSVSSGSSSSSSSKVKFTTSGAFPKGFNPKVSETKITYKLSATGYVSIVIVDQAGSKKVELLTNEKTTGGKDASLSWDGTTKKGGGGAMLKSGKYYAKMTVKSSASGSVSDTKSVEINVIYASESSGSDMSDMYYPSLSGSSTDRGSTGSSSATLASGRTGVAKSHTLPKQTSSTGPEALIYLVAPVMGYFVSRRKK